MPPATVMNSSDTTQLLALPARPTVLLVDDDELSRELLLELMRQEGFSAKLRLCRGRMA
jgi:hypothetical protein